LLYKAKLDQQHPNFVQSRGFIPLKFTRNQNGWQLIPVRQVTGIDNQYGLWPALERASQASQAGGAQPQYSQPEYSQPQLSPQPQYSQPQFQQQGGYGGYPQQNPYQQAPGFELFPQTFGSFPQEPQQYPQPPYSNQAYGQGYGSGYPPQY